MYQKHLCNVNRMSYVTLNCGKSVAQEASTDQLSQGNLCAVILPEVKTSGLIGYHFSKQQRKDILIRQTSIFALLSRLNSGSLVLEYKS